MRGVSKDCRPSEHGARSWRDIPNLGVPLPNRVRLTFTELTHSSRLQLTLHCSCIVSSIDISYLSFSLAWLLFAIVL
jgi:hypothetical protein